MFALLLKALIDADPSAAARKVRGFCCEYEVEETTLLHLATIMQARARGGGAPGGLRAACVVRCCLMSFCASPAMLPAWHLSGSVCFLSCSFLLFSPSRTSRA